MPVGLSGSAMVPPACSVAGLIAVRVRLPKLPTSTSPGAAAMVWGPDPTGMAAPGCRVRDVDRRHRVAAEVGDERGRRARGRHRDGDGHRLGSHRNGLVPARQVPRSTGVTLFESRFATSATPLPPLPPGATATASGSTPTPTSCTHLVGRRVDLVQLVVALRHDEQLLAPGRVGQRGGQAADGDLGLDVPPGQVDRRHVHARQGDRGAGRSPRPRRAPTCCRPGWAQAASAGTTATSASEQEPAAAHASRSAPGAGRARRPVRRAPSGRVALGPEVAGDVVLHVGHGRRLAGGQRPAARRAARRRRRRSCRARSWPGPHRECALRSPRCTAARAWSTPSRPDAEQADQVGVRAEAAVAHADPELRAQPGRHQGVVHPVQREGGHAPSPSWPLGVSDRGPSTCTPSMDRKPSYEPCRQSGLVLP